MSARYEKARAIAEAAANHWDKFQDTAGINWLTDAILAATAVSQPPTTRHGAEDVEALRALSEKATPGEWRVCEMDNHGTSPSDRWLSYGIEVGDGIPKGVLDTLNSGVAMLDEERDGEGGGVVWDEQGKRDIEFVAALVNAYRRGHLARASDAEHYMKLSLDKGAQLRKAQEEARSWRSVAERLQAEAQVLTTPPASAADGEGLKPCPTEEAHLCCYPACTCASQREIAPLPAVPASGAATPEIPAQPDPAPVGEGDAIEALKLCLAELDWQTEQAKHCGDPNYECPMQDIHNPDDGHLLARNAARAALTSESSHVE